MPCCLVGCLAMIGPRFAAIVWWILDSALWARAFDTVLVPIVGILFLPWTTLAYVFVSPGGIGGIDWLWIGIGIMLDLFSWGGGFGNRSRYRTYYVEYRDRY
jgi:hypothetical protein